MNRKSFFITVVVLLLAAAGFMMLRNDDSETAEDTSSDQVTMVNTSEDDTQQQDEDSDTNTQDTTTPDNPKTPQLSGNVTEKPIISSSFGLVSEAPAPDGQLISTSCNTEPNVDCVLEFTNQETSEIVIFEVKQTGSLGNAIWEWTAGEDIPSGTWDSVAKAGDKTSDKEVIYVQ